MKRKEAESNTFATAAGGGRAESVRDAGSVGHDVHRAPDTLRPFTKHSFIKQLCFDISTTILIA